MQIDPELPCPEVQEGDVASYLRRARWLLEHRSWKREEINADLRQAIQLDASLWEPWTMLADLASDDAALQLHFYDEAIRHGAGRQTQWQRAGLLLQLDRFTEAEQEYTRIIDENPSDLPWLMLAKLDRALARVQLGDYEGAVSDMSVPDLSRAPFHTRELLGRFQWIQGDFAGAYQTFMAEKSQQVELFRIWAHLCQVGHGLRHTTMPLRPGEGAPNRVNGVRVLPTKYDPRMCDAGPPQPGLWVWDLLTELFLDRITPDLVLAAARSALAESDARQLPKTSDQIPISSFYIPHPNVWRSELLFYCGMWHLSKDDTQRARQALSEAAVSDLSRSLEKLAAQEQLRRIADGASPGTPAKPVRPLELAPLPSSTRQLDQFVGLNLKLPGLSPTRQGAVLEFGGYDLGDQGLATLLSSPNLRFIVRLDLQANNITAAGMAAFRASSFILNIAELNLADNPIGDEGLNLLLDSAALLALSSLNLTNTELTDAGAQMLAEQEYIQFDRLCFGNTPLDMASWLRLADRYGESLYARGVFLTPYKPPFDPQLRVCFSSPVDGETGHGRSGSGRPSSSPRCELTFSMREHVARLWEQAAVERHKSWLPDFLDRIRWIRELESKCAAWTEKVYMIEGFEGFSMLEAGFDPISLHCPMCARTYARPESHVVMSEFSDMRRRFRCPQGHVLLEQSD
jgi:Leucine Rich repeat